MLTQSIAPHNAVLVTISDAPLVVWHAVNAVIRAFPSSRVQFVNPEGTFVRIIRPRLFDEIVAGLPRDLY